MAAVAASQSFLWPFEGATFIHDDDRGSRMVLEFIFLDGTDAQQDLVRTTILAREKLDRNFDTWEDFANVRFRELAKGEGKSGNIRITFDPEASGVAFHSMVGTAARDVEDPNRHTMKLGGLPVQGPYGDRYHRPILHEFGHALGLKHEHQSPAMGDSIKLNRDKVIEGRYEGDEARAKRNMLDSVKNPINYTQFDKHSIMMYSLEKELQEGDSAEDIPRPKKLSELDKAFIQLLYPPDVSNQWNVEQLRQAMITVGLPEEEAEDILNDFVEKERTALARRFTAMRNRFNRSKNRGVALWGSKLKTNVSQTTNLSLKQFGVNRSSIAMHDEDGRYVGQYDCQLSEESNVASRMTSESQGSAVAEEPRQIPDKTQLDPKEWAEKNKEVLSSAFAQVTKPGDGSTITIVFEPLEKQAEFHSDGSSPNLNSQVVDINGELYFIKSANVS